MAESKRIFPKRYMQVLGNGAKRIGSAIARKEGGSNAFNTKIKFFLISPQPQQAHVVSL